MRMSLSPGRALGERGGPEEEGGLTEPFPERERVERERERERTERGPRALTGAGGGLLQDRGSYIKNHLGNYFRVLYRKIL